MSVRAERRAACRRLPFNAVAGGVTPRVSGGKRGFSPERGERPADSFLQQLGRYVVIHLWHDRDIIIRLDALFFREFSSAANASTTDSVAPGMSQRGRFEAILK